MQGQSHQVGADQVWAVIPAAGIGQRMGNATKHCPKQYIPLRQADGTTPSMLETTLARLDAVVEITKLVVGLHPQDQHFYTLPLKLVTPFQCVLGGQTRAHTVLNALDAVIAAGGEHDLALVHDAARPCVRVDEIDALIQTAQNSQHGAILAMPMTDTLKRVDTQGMIDATVPRDFHWRAATPQCFQVSALRSALASALDAGLEVSDEASAMEWAGHQPKVLACSSDNIKITTKDDLALAEAILAIQANS